MNRDRLLSINEESAIARLRFARNSGRFVMWVEGPDDCVVFERFSSDKCSVKELGGRKAVLRTVREALQTRPAIPGGFIGLIDRDFDNLAAEQLPGRVVAISERFNDLESAMLALTGAELLKDLVRKEHREAIPWLCKGEDPLDLLARFVTAPIGAIRSNWDAQHGSIEANGHPVDLLLRRTLPETRLDSAELSDLLAEKVPRLNAERLAQLAYRAYDHPDPWRITRGKDMVRAIAVVLGNHREACTYGEDGAGLLERRIHERIVTLYDPFVLHQAGTLERIRRAICSFDEKLADYLDVPSAPA